MKTQLILWRFCVAFLLSLPRESSSNQMSNTCQQKNHKPLFGRKSRQNSDFNESGNDEKLRICEDHKTCFGQYCLPKDYDRSVLPWTISKDNETNSPVDVNLDFDVRIFEVNDQKFTISFTMYFGVKWYEPRLVKKNDSKTNNASMDRVSLEMLQHLWIPNIYVLNLKSFKTLDIFSEFAGIYLIFISSIF